MSTAFARVLLPLLRAETFKEAEAEYSAFHQAFNRAYAKAVEALYVADALRLHTFN